MTFVNKKTRLFLDRGDIKPERRRSEARLKTYPSSIDIRAWCGIVEDRRQHILELIYKGKEKCMGQLIPLEAIVNSLVALRVADCEKLKKCMVQLWQFILNLNLNDEDKQKLLAMREALDSVCKKVVIDPGSEATTRKLRKDECVAQARHEKELAEINELLNNVGEGGTYKVIAKGPARITTRIKGFQAPSGMPLGSITTRAQGNARFKTILGKKTSNASGPQSQRSLKRSSKEKSEDQFATPTKETSRDQHESRATIPSRLSWKSMEGQNEEQSTHPSLSQSGSRRSKSMESASREKSQTRSHNSQMESTGKTPESMVGFTPLYNSSMIAEEGENIAGPRKQLAEHSTEKTPESLAGFTPLYNSSMIAEEGQNIAGPRKQLAEPSTEKTPESLAGFTPLYNSSMIAEEGQNIAGPRKQLPAPSPKNTEELRIQLEARETLCNELQATLGSIKNERDGFKQKLEATLEELEALKKLNAGSPIIPTSCKEEIEALELEIKVMRSGNLSPEQEAEVIKKEVEVLKKYCLKLKSVEDENEKLKLERDTLKSQVNLPEDSRSEKQKSAKDNLNRQVAGIQGDNDKVKTADIPSEDAKEDESGDKVEEITKERDMLANKVQRLEKELLQYRDLPEDLEVYRNRSKMLDSALEERDKMSKKVEQIKSIEDEMNQLRKKSARVDELEEELKTYSKNDKNVGSELKKTKSKCTCLERELQNVKMERDSMRTRIEYMKKEIEMLKGKSKEAEIYKLERDKLQIKVNELAHVQMQYENLLLKCKCLENAAAEKEMYKQKYEEVVTMECQGDMLRSQMETAKNLEREKNGLVKQVGDLECCICEQEDEIKKLVLQIDNLCRNKDDNQCRMREALASMRAEIEKKDCLIEESEQKLAAVQAQLKSSIQGVSCETTCYRTRIEELERELTKAQTQITTLQKQINDRCSSYKGIEKINQIECEAVCAMKREIKTAKEENKRLREITGKMVALTGDEHLKNMLKQSQCAVKRVVEELGRQYKEWDILKHNQKKGIYVEGGKQAKYSRETSPMSDSENEKLVEELEDIQREKEKLELLVKQINDDKMSKGPQKELISLRIENTKLQEQLEKEKRQRRDLEKKLKA